MTARIPFTDVSALTAQVRTEVDDAWRDVVDAGCFVRGPHVGEFEQELAEYCGTQYAVGVANGTDALVLTLRALGIGPGDDVVVPANTFVATVEAVVLVGARPRFADVDPDTLLITAATFQAAWTPRTRAVVAVHLFGQPVATDALCRVADRLGVAVVEDAAQAHGARWLGTRVGSLGTVACFSFYPGKNLGAFGDGGAVVTSRADLASTVSVLRDHGRSNGSHYDHVAVGTNSRLDTLQAAVLSVKLRHLDRWNEQRREVAGWYEARLTGSPVRWVGSRPEAEPVHHLAVVRVPARDRVRAALASQGIETGIHYPIPCHLLEPYREFADRALPEVEHAGLEILSLPMFPGLRERQVQRVCDALSSAVEAGVLADVV